MQYLAINFSGKVRRERLHNRDYLVAPLTMIVPGVLNGSQGALFYPPHEIKKNTQAWNGIPLTVGHPTRNGQQLSGRDPSVLNETGIGYVFHAHAKKGKLQAEGWFDVDAMKKVDNRIYDALVNGRKIELSTGLFTQNEPASRGSKYNGKPYTHIARNYRPDHLAILPDQVGACSVNDGCGVNVNTDMSDQSAPAETCKCGGSCDKCIAKNKCSEDMEHNAECTCETEGPDKCPVHGTTDNALVNQPKSLVSGRWKRPNAGVGKGEPHEAAQRGALYLDTDDHAKGALAKAEADAGHNPVSWVEDEDKWTKAKAAADKGEYDADTYWAVVTHIYKQMGGGVKGSTDNAWCPTGAGGGQDNSCSGKGGGGGDSDFRAGASVQHKFSKRKMVGTIVDKGSVKSLGGWSKEAIDDPEMVLVHYKGHASPTVVPKSDLKLTKNAFCPTGADGGQDNSCGGKGDASGTKVPKDYSEKDHKKFLAKQKKLVKDHLKRMKEGRPSLREERSTKETQNSSGGNRSHSVRRRRLGAKLTGVLNMKRDDVIDSLVANCDCFDEEDRDTLNSLNDKKLKKLHESLVDNAMYADEEDEEEDEEMMEEEEEAPKKKKPGGFFQKNRKTNNRRNRDDDIAQDILNNRKKPQTADEWFATAPAEIQSAVRNAMTLEQQTKKGLLDQLTANVNDDQVQRVLNRLKTKSIEELQDLVALIPPARQIAAPSFIGASVPYPGQVSNERAIDKDDDDVLPMPTINYAAEYAEARRNKTAKVS